MKQTSMRRNLIIAIVLVFILLGGLIFHYLATSKKNIFQSSADTTGASITLDPAGGTYKVGDKLTFDVKLDTAGKYISGFNIKGLSFDPALLGGGVIKNGDIDSSNSNDVIFAPDNTIDKDKGKIYFAASFTDTNAGGDHVGFSGSGKIATITFDVLATGTADLTFDSGTTINDFTTGDNILASVPSGGSYTIGGATPPPASPTSSPTPTLTPAPTISVSASHKEIDTGGTTTISWATTNLDQTTCVATPAGWFDTTKASGSATVSPTVDATYSLTCGSLSDQTKVTVDQPGSAPTVTLEVNGQQGSTSIDSGATATLSWATAHAKTCTASGGWSGSQSLNGSSITTNLTATTIYTLTCRNSSGSTPSSVTVNINQPVADGSIDTPPDSTPAPTDTPASEPTETPSDIALPTVEPVPSALAYLPSNILPAVAPIKHPAENTQQIYAGDTVKGWTMWLFYAIIPLTLVAGAVYYYIRRRQNSFNLPLNQPVSNKPVDIWKNPQF